MCGPANEIIDSLMARKGAVTTFVGKNPDSCSNAALEEPICGPSNNAQRQRREKMDVEGSVDQSCTIDDVPKQVEKRCCEGRFKAFFRNCIFESLQARNVVLL